MALRSPRSRPAPPATGSVGGTGPITCDSGGAKKCHSDVVYSPVANFNGADQFTFTATGPAGPDSAIASIVIAAANDAPVCTGDTSSGNEDTAQSGTVVCTDADLNPLTYSKVAGPAHGTASVAINGGWSYTPAANYNGPDSFTFKANDGTADSNVATVSITVTPVNDAPAWRRSLESRRRQGLGQAGHPEPLDIDGDPLTYAEAGVRAAHGCRSRTAPESSTYTPPRLQRPGQLHVQGHRRDSRLERRDGDDHGRSGERRTGGGRSVGHDGRGHGQAGHPDGHRRRRRPADVRAGDGPGARRLSRTAPSLSRRTRPRRTTAAPTASPSGPTTGRLTRTWRR